MAVYGFTYQSFGERFEVTLPVTERDPLREQRSKCPKRNNRESRQLVSTFSSQAPSDF